MYKRILLAALVLLSLPACDSATGTGTGNVTVRFAAASAAGASSRASLNVSAAAEGDQIVVSGANGTLTITDIRLIASEFKLERVVRIVRRARGRSRGGLREVRGGTRIPGLSAGRRRRGRRLA